MTTEFDDCISSAHVHYYVMELLSSNESVEAILKKLEEVSDIQWHTYELPNSTLQDALCKWLIQNWNSGNQSYLESVLDIAYCFGLDKELYIRALSLYLGEYLCEFKRNLDMSMGGSINPWWSMQLKNA